MSRRPFVALSEAKGLHFTGRTCRSFAALRMTTFAATLFALSTPASAQDFAAFDRYVADAAKAWHVPALGIAVVRNDSLVFAKGYGVIEIGKPQAADAHTRFAIGSTTKAMTSAALAMLVDEGKIRWDGRVIDYLPEFQLYDPYVTREITIRDLLTHRSGLPSTDLLWAGLDYSLEESTRRLRFVKPASSFRSQWEYQNNVYAIGGLIIERVSGMSWENFIRTRIFAPLGMTESETLVSEIIGKPNVAVPHAERGDTVRVVPIRSTDGVAPAGSVWSSVTDMSKWMRFVLDSGRVGSKRLISEANFREIVAPQIRAPVEEYPALSLARPSFFSYGFGWFVQDYRGQPVWMHTGSINGMSAIIGLLPQQKVGVYVLENLDHAELRHALMYRVFDMYEGGASRDWSTDVHTLFAASRGSRAAPPVRHADVKPSLTLDHYAGTYADSTYGTIKVTLANGVLRAQIATQPEVELEPWEYEQFRTRSSTPQSTGTPLIFVPDGMGGISAVRMSGVNFARVRGTSR
jgi:CubicO group peptidase (beta-lactamase class C family)